jgi:hypothetical protein
MWMSLARCKEPGTSREDRGESLNRALCPSKDGDALVRPARVAFLSLAFCEMVLATCGEGCSFLSDLDDREDLVSGSGEKEGKEVSAGSGAVVEEADSDADADALEPARLGAPRTVRTFLLSEEALDVCEDDRLERLLPLSDITDRHRSFLC